MEDIKKQVWKYNLNVEMGENKITMPYAAENLQVGVDQSHPENYRALSLWVMVNPEAQQVERTFLVVGTGFPLPNNKIMKYIGTVVTKPFAWHVFEMFEMFSKGD